MLLKQCFFFLALISLVNTSYADESSFFLQFDHNRDSILQENELNEVFNLLQPTIVEKFGLKEKDEKYAESIFLFHIIKSERINDENLLEFLSFHLCLRLSHCKNAYLAPIQANQLQLQNFLALLR